MQHEKHVEITKQLASSPDQNRFYSKSNTLLLFVVGSKLKTSHFAGFKLKTMTHNFTSTGHLFDLYQVLSFSCMSCNKSSENKEQMQNGETAWVLLPCIGVDIIIYIWDCNISVQLPSCAYASLCIANERCVAQD